MIFALRTEKKDEVNNYTASRPFLDSRESVRAESAQRVETAVRRKRREETGPLPTSPPLVRSSFSLLLGYFARLRDNLKRDC